MRSRRGITAAAIRERVASYRTIDDVMSDQSEVGVHAQRLLLSLRFIHHTMNGPGQIYADTDVLARLKRSVECSDALQTSFRRVESPGGESPALFMNGLDLAHFVPASLHQIWLGLAGNIKPEACSHGILGNVVERVRRGMWLSIVILSNICPPTAQALTAKLVRKEPVWSQGGEKPKYTKVVRNEPGWIKIYPTVVILGAGAYDGDCRDADALMAFVEEEFPLYAHRIEELLLALLNAYKNLSNKIVISARDSASRVGEPGWTTGAYHQAWLEPAAEISFLNRCSKFILFKKSLDDGAQRRGRAITILPTTSSGGRKRKRRWRLPLIHPVENVQQIFRRQFDPLQIPDLIPSTKVQEQDFRKFATNEEAARSLPAWSSLNSDPGLAERIGSHPASAYRRHGRLRVFTTSEINFSKDWAWQRDWSSCGRI